MRPKIKFTNVTKKYNLYKKQSDKLLDILLFRKRSKSFYALKDVSFEVYAGETIGVIGINGSGKSTLSNLLAQVVPPTSGEIEINGETSLIAISVGLNNNLSGLDNIETKCLMHGMTKKEIEEIKPHIIAFADIGDFIMQPVKNYSSGMKSRLGFAISVHIDPDILVIDEALSVGDETFYEKCVGKINEFKEKGKTIFFISHSIPQVRSMSDKVLWLHHGRIKEFGRARNVIGNYKEFLAWYKDLSEAEKKQYKVEMMKEQSTDIYLNRLNRNNKTHKNTNLLTFLQILLLSIGTTFGALFMFIDSPLALIQSKDLFQIVSNDSDNKDDISINTENNTEEKVEEITINEKGFVTATNVSVYFDLNEEFKLNDLVFATEVYIDSQIGDYYKVSFNDEIGYIKSNNLTTLTDKVNQGESTVGDFYPLFPERFASSYEYYLAFLGETFYEINDIFIDAEENTDNMGRTILSYEYDNVTYRFNEEEVADTIIIDSINDSEELVLDLAKYAKFHSNDKKLFYFAIQNYNLILDLNQNTIKIQEV
ncbi:teichoic acids export ABC transporter ATP-binding subunit TagH [Sutcliffiella horikoshii]|uniref:teichoic acids export ABC transporter ATP-binding subunit TagH n=1 Tax=Sutcliffiella horikoshii TaxID=79883 RepID=UPI00384D4F24